MSRMTVHDFLRAKGRRQLTQTFTLDPREAAACNAAGIDVIVTMAGDARAIRAAAPDVFLVAAIDHAAAAESDAQAIRLAHEGLAGGADAAYCGTHNLDRIAALAAAAVPVIGHVGLVPYRDTWLGGKRAVGKTADEALDVYRRTRAYEDAGAIAVEMEVVPHQVAAAISSRVKLIGGSRGSGEGCDGQYLFVEDILGTHRRHYPRHAKRYRDLFAEYERLDAEMRDAFAEFKADVDTGRYPQPSHRVNAPDDELARFLARLDAED